MSIFDRTIQTRYIGEVSTKTIKQNPELIRNAYEQRITKLIEENEELKVKIEELNKDTQVCLKADAYYKIKNYGMMYGHLQGDWVTSYATMLNINDVIYAYEQIEERINKIKQLEKHITSNERLIRGVDRECDKILKS